MNADPRLVSMLRAGRPIPPGLYEEDELDAAQKVLKVRGKIELALLQKMEWCRSCFVPIPDDPGRSIVFGKDTGGVCDICRPAVERAVIREQLESANVPQHFLEAVIAPGERYARPMGKHWTLILGAVGVGKTFRAVQLVIGTWGARFVSWPEFITARKLAMSAKTADPLGEVQSHRRLLVLDDLGSEPEAPYSVQSANEVLPYRYDRNLPTIITSNLNLEALTAFYGKRLGSRLCEAADIVILKETRDLRRIAKRPTRLEAVT